MNRHHSRQCRIETPLGLMLAARTDRGLSGLWFDGQRHHPGKIDAPGCSNVGEDAFFARLQHALNLYFNGGAAPDLPLDPQGTDFQREVWQALLEIAPGEVASYGSIAARLGRPNAARALGAAVGRNPISILIPCHRVLGASGELTGYAGGIERKKALLALEAR